MADRSDRVSAAPDTGPMTPEVMRVRRRRRDGPDVWTLDVEPEGGRAGDLAFAPGQFNMLTAFGVGEVPISLSGDPAGTGRFVHTIRAVGPVSQALAAMKAGTAIGVRGPFGAGWPLESADGRDVVVVAGGLGLAPLRPALYRLMASRERYGKIVLVYGARNPEGILYRHELERWRRRLDMEIEVTVDHATSDWRGHVGVVTTFVEKTDFDPQQTTAFVCGPEVMMRFAIAALRHAGVDDAAIHLSMERNMKCAIGHCGHCQFGPAFVCRDGPVFGYDRIGPMLAVKEV